MKTHQENPDLYPLNTKEDVEALHRSVVDLIDRELVDLAFRRGELPAKLVNLKALHEAGRMTDTQVIDALLKE